MEPILYIVIPCFNESDVLPLTAPVFLEKLRSLCIGGLVSDKSRILFVNDGSSDDTWQIISALVDSDPHFAAISLSRNCGHQNALMAGIMYSKDRCDITVSIDCDGQDDPNAIDNMVKEYLDGADVVYGVRSDRRSDTRVKRGSAHLFYKLMRAMGAETVYNNADYRLLSKRVMEALSEYKEVNVYLRGMIPLVGFKSTCVYYERRERKAGKTHYPLKKMLSLALDGITSLSVKPIHIIALFGFAVALVSFVGIIWSVVTAIAGKSVSGWASIVSIICFLGGIQLLSLGVIGEYIGKTYLETKARPRYIIDKIAENTAENTDK